MKFPILVSYAYARLQGRKQEFEALTNWPDVEIMLDSGAFTAHTTGAEIKLDEYCGFIDQYCDKIGRYAALDVLGNPTETDRNLRAMVGDGYRPAAVHVFGDDQRRMDELYDLVDFVCIGGLLRPGRGRVGSNYVKAVMGWAAGRPTHWFGYVKPELFRSLRPTSVDSSTFASAARYGVCSVYLGSGRWIRAQYSTRERLLSSRQAMRHIRACGISPRRLSEITWRNTVDRVGSSAIDITIDSWVRYVVDLYQRFGVKVFMALSMNQTETIPLRQALDRHADTIAAAQPPEALCLPSSA